MQFEDIDIETLPGVLMSDRFFRRGLPAATTAVYFVVSKKHGVIYIGQTKDLNKRWYRHQQIDDVFKLGDCTLHWLVVPVSELLTTERAMAKIHKPPQSEWKSYHWSEGPTQLAHDLGRLDHVLHGGTLADFEDEEDSEISSADAELAVIREILAILDRLGDPRQKQRISRYVLDRMLADDDA